MVAELWLRDIDDSDRALRTKITYRENWQRYLKSVVGELRLRDMRVSRVDRIVRDLREHSGSGTATHAKVVLSGILGLAVRHDALEANPVRELTRDRRGGSAKKTKINLAEESFSRLHQHLRASPDALKYDMVDLVDVLSGLGCRIGELLALDWTKIDDTAGTVAIEGTVIRVPGEGLIVQSHTKSSAGMRTIAVADWVMAIFVRRHATAEGQGVFPSTRGTLRDPDNTRSQLRTVLAGTEWVGLHPHAFRRRVATQLDVKGLSAREIADYLGHERVSMTQDVYMSRRITGTGAADALNGLNGLDESVG
ncbi:site-specific integrase [Pseudonocardia sp. GCM10023141]|uniref:site-specific integrase n=1 Tax=Pseudonocardia sp. GCM10023141 TaxID=3252653 RepID=UPI0036123124